MKYELHCGDALEWLKSLPTDSADLLFTSPPYEAARTYGIGFSLTGEEWVAWMVEIIKEASRVVKGLVAVNCEGQTRNYRYSCVPFLLAADLHRAGFNLRKPVVFHRVGIPGSGGPDWLRNDWEPVVCVTRSGQLLWSEPTACGKPPKFAPGGEMSHRLKSGDRVNQWGMRIKKSGDLSATEPTTGVAVPRQMKPSHRVIEIGAGGYLPPALANPGNVLKFNVGGGFMGHHLAKENEAPFPLGLAEFFVKSFAPPGGLVLDPFCGSGTTGHACLIHGRRFAGCDVRQSQIDLSRRRLRTVTPTLLAEVQAKEVGAA